MGSRQSPGGRLAARNRDTGALVASSVRIADTHTKRAVGLLGRRELEPGEGLWIVPSRGLHTCGMRFSIDVVGLDCNGRVIDLVRDLRPWRIRLPRTGIVGVLEVAAGAVDASGTAIGHSLVFEVVSTKDDAPGSV